MTIDNCHSFKLKEGEKQDKIFFLIIYFQTSALKSNNTVIFVN